ncbi:MAG: GH92 family glycosyl hydrolase [Bacteroidota bacterium]
MRSVLLFTFGLLASFYLAAQSPDYTALVNPLMGSDSEHSLSNGNTYPAIARPWGMNFWTPQTGEMGNGWLYGYDDYQINGFRQTHQPSPWINDYAAFSIMPMTGKMAFREKERASWFSHKAETVLPHHYQVYLADYDITAEMTPTDRAVKMRFTFPESEQAYIVLDAWFKGSMVKILPKERKIIGYCRNNNGGVPANFHNYFVAEFDKDFVVSHTWAEDSLYKGQLEAEGKHVGAIIGFLTERGEQVHVSIASSFISPEQAQLNLDREIGKRSFEEIKAEGKRLWNEELGRIEVKGGQLSHQQTFYSCLYRMLLFPRKFYEYNQAGDLVHYSPYNGEVKPGYMFTDNGFWDTFRAVFPFFALMYPEMNEQIMKGLANTYRESGWLPEWASPGHRDCMIGSNSASLIADAFMKGQTGEATQTLYEAVLHNTEGKGPVNSVGRYGAEYYNELGYVPYDVDIRENAARTLEYAYADFCIWQMAKALKRPQKEIDLFAQRAQNYKNLYDAESGLMRGKNEDGKFQAPFNPFKWGDAFTEGNSWHYTWSVFHDVAGLIALMGGEKAFAQKLDSVFLVPPIFDYSYYGFVIHEIREMQIAGMGNYAHGNQPIQHMIYLYNYAGQPWKSQYHAREVLTKLYQPTPDGYCGDEDNGQTSAWYVFSALGFYPVCPGTDEYVMGSPLFEEVILHLPNQKQFSITAEDNMVDAPYIQSAELHGKNWEHTYLRHEDIMKGGSLRMKMGKSPQKDRGTAVEHYPYSMSRP